MFTAAAAVFIAIGVISILKQKELIASARPVQGTITSSEVRQVESTDQKNRRTTTYRPLVRYHISSNGSIYGYDRVFPLSQETSRTRAQEIVNRFPPGKDVTVWVVPPRPTHMGDQFNAPTAFLLREWDFSPYLIVLCAMIFLAVGVGFWSAAPWRRQKVWPPKAASGGWHEIPLRANLTARRRPFRAVSLVWFVIGGVTAGHYLLHADRPYDPLALVAIPLYFALGFIPIFLYFRELRRARTFRDARLTANTDTFWVGKPFNVKLEQPCKKPATIELARIGLVCDRTDTRTRREKTVASKSDQFETWEEFRAGETVSPDHPLQTKARFTVPTGQPPTTPDTQRGYPRHTWRLTVEVTLTNHRRYRADFPITVES
jgi:hypothetical protein